MSYDSKLRDLQDHIQDDVVILLTDPTTIVKQSLLTEMPQLCIFFGKQKSNDFLISHIITYLNDVDWKLRRCVLS
jgi:phosphoinositide-3-kinase, regulatory subunit 4